MQHLLRIQPHSSTLRPCCITGASGDLPKAVAEVVRPAAVAAYQEALASVLTSGAVAKKKKKEAALKSLEESFVLLQLYANGTELLEVGVDGCSAVDEWVFI